MTDRQDPLDEIDQPTPAERIEPYRKYGDAELAVTLWHYEKKYGGCGTGSPAAVGYDYHCPECEENVRGVTIPDEQITACPLCGHSPGILARGRGPK